MSHPVKDILTENGYRLIDSGDFWKTSARYRDGHNPTAVSIRKRDGCFWDWATGTHGTAEQLVKLIKGEEVSFEGYTPEPEQEKLQMPTIYPKEILRKLLPHFDLYLNRGISEETLRTFECGMAHSGKLNRRICFPIYDRRGRIIGFDGRWYQENPPDNCPKSKKIGRKTDWLYPCHLNEAIIKTEKLVIITEGISDILALWDAGVKVGMAIFGTRISPKQILYLISLDPERIIISLNNEPGNDSIGNEAAEKLRKKLLEFFSEEKVIIKLPPKKDFGEMTKQSIQKFYEQVSQI